MKHFRIAFIALLTSLHMQAQKSPADTCVIDITGYFCPNCPMDTALQGWLIICNDACGIVKKNFKVYEPVKRKLIHNSAEHWSGLLNVDNKGNRTYYPSGSYFYEIEFYKSDHSVIKKKGSVYLSNYEHSPEIR